MGQINAHTTESAATLFIHKQQIHDDIIKILVNPGKCLSIFPQTIHSLLVIIL